MDWYDIVAIAEVMFYVSPYIFILAYSFGLLFDNEPIEVVVVDDENK